MPHHFRMSIGAHPGGVGEVNAAFAGFAEENALPAAVRRSLNVALDELLANALSHGLVGRERDDARVTVEAELNRDHLTVTVSDDGPPFDPFGLDDPDTTLDLEDRPIGGLGLHLVRRLVDEVSYERRDGCNVVVLVKRFGEGEGEGDGTERSGRGQAD